MTIWAIILLFAGFDNGYFRARQISFRSLTQSQIWIASYIAVFCGQYLPNVQLGQ